MSGRLTQEARSAIVAKALAHTFAAREEALKETCTQLADEMYHWAFGGVEAAAKALPAGWIKRDDTLVIEADGWTHKTDYWHHGRIVEAEGPYNHLKLSVERCMPSVAALRAIRIEKGHALFPHSQRIVKEHRAIRESRKALKEKLNALLNSVTTFKQLREAWPEGEQFFPAEAKPVHAVVPATLTHDINRMLGLEPSGPARKVIKKAMRKELS